MLLPPLLNPPPKSSIRWNRLATIISSPPAPVPLPPLSTAMARSDSFRFFAFLLIACGVAVLSARRTDPATETYEYLVDCATKLAEQCGYEIFSNIFADKEQLTPQCCKKLVSMGKECHEAMVNFIIISPTYSKNASITVPRSKKVWKECVSLAKGASALP
ncbi:hypothetical protein NL676_036378 [Syzygium grande]|nr:hypothetical protein NL676_036378 [Syzygium grande]